MVIPRTGKAKHRLLEVAPIDTFLVKYVNPKREEKVGIAFRTDVPGGYFFFVPDSKTGAVEIATMAPSLLEESVKRMPKLVIEARLADIEARLQELEKVVGRRRK